MGLGVEPVGDVVERQRAQWRERSRRYRLAGKHAVGQKRWRDQAQQDPVYRAGQAARHRAYKQRPEVRYAQQLGLPIPVARAILEATS